MPVRRATVPRVRATTLVIHTNLLPERRALLHLVIWGEGKARLGNELDRWRLFDLQNNTVTFVDDIERTYQTETLASLLRKKRRLLRENLPESIPVAEFENTPHQQQFDSFHALLSTARLGGYQRSLWMSTDVPVPEQLFSLIAASDTLSTPYAPAMAQVVEGMLKLKGFPVIDRSDVTYGDQTHVVEKRLLRVEERMVPASWLQVPADYKDLTPKPTSPDRRPPLRRALERFTR
jgi:hypothetical protein